MENSEKHLPDQEKPALSEQSEQKVDNLAILKEIDGEFRKNPLLWGIWHTKHHFQAQSPKFHFNILKNCLKSKYLAVASPRGSAKSTILAFLYPLFCIIYKKRHHIVLVSNTFSKAANALETIKREIRDNERLKLYGISLEKDREGDSVFKHPDGFRTRFLCKGAEQVGSIRGEKFGAYRPDLIIGDDIEDDELVRNPERRIVLKEEFDDALIPAGSMDCQYIIIGTILHDDSQMAKLVDPDHYTEYTKIVYKALNKTPNGEVSLWEEKWSVEWLKNLERMKPEVFAKEYQNDPVAGEMAKFHRENFRYWRVEGSDYLLFDHEGNITNKGLLRNCKAAIACDLAWREKRNADSSVILSAFLTPTGEILVDNYISRKGLRPDTFAEYLFTAEERLRTLTGQTIPVGFEKSMLEKVTQWVLRQRMRETGRWLVTKELSWELDKIQRILTVLEPKYAQNIIYHKRNMGDLEHQLLRFPSGTHDDIVDALQGVCRLLVYPKRLNKKKVSFGDEGFEWLRKYAIESKKEKKEAFVFGNRNKWWELPAIKTWR